MSINPNDTIRVADLAQVSVGPSDKIVGVQNGVARLFPATGLPASTQLDGRIAVLEQSQGSGVVGFATKAAMDASLGFAEGSIAKVTNDAGNSGEYRKIGAIGTGSWVRSEYDPKTEVVRMGSLMRNRGSTYPLRAATRAGTTSSEQSIWSNAVLDVRVIGAREGKLYRLSFFKNGAALAGPQDGWIIEEHSKATYGTTNSPLVVLHYTNPAPDIPRDGAVHTVRLISPIVVGLEILITVDTSQLPALGNSVDANSSNARPAWSWIIDPSAYEYARTEFAGGGLAVSGIHVSGDRTSGEFRIVLPMGRTHMARVTCRPNGKNGLFNIRRIEIANAGSAKLATWTVMSDTDTDWMPPLIMRAASNGDGSTTRYYTGGNHGSDGSSGGAVTAAMSVFAVDVDGRSMGPSDSVDGYARVVTFRWANEVMGYNTISYARAIARQWFTLQFTEHGIECMCTVEALEPIVVEQDNGLQVVGAGFDVSCHYYDGVAKARQPVSSAMNSGMKAAAPNAWAMSLASPNGFLNCWMDRAFGLGNGSHVHPNDAYMRKNASILKFYHAVISRADVELPMAAGNRYEWRGGYSFSPASIVFGTGLDSAFVMSRGAKPRLAWAFTSAGVGEVRPPVLYAGRDVGSGSIGATGMVVSATGYATSNEAVI